MKLMVKCSNRPPADKWEFEQYLQHTWLVGDAITLAHQQKKWLLGPTAAHLSGPAGSCDFTLSVCPTSSLKEYTDIT